MKPSRVLKWSGGVVLGLVLFVGVVIALFDWNWLRGPIMRAVTDKTGRELVIHGDLKVKLGWPALHVSTSGLTFANPAWAKEQQMVTVESLEFSVDVPQLFKRNVILPEVQVGQAVISLEEGADDRRNWLLDNQQKDEKARIQIDRLTLDQAQLNYDNAERKISIQSEISSQKAVAGDTQAPGIVFKAKGIYKDLPLTAQGTGGSVLGLRDETLAYPLNVDATIGTTTIQAGGTITSLIKFSAIDMDLALRGESVAKLFPLVGIALPETRPYEMRGHIAHNAQMWSYENFSGRMGESDIAGSLQLKTGGKRPFLQGDLQSKVLNFADLAPMIGKEKKDTKDKKVVVAEAPKVTAANVRVLPELPFRTERWDSVDADVKLKANSIRRPKELPIENLDTHLKMSDSVLTLDPLKFGVAGGNLTAQIALDGQKDPIHAHAKIQVRKLHIGQLFPTLKNNQASIGNINGDFELSGDGNSVAHILATSNGRVALVIAGGVISKLMMESVGLHLWEMLQLKIAGDQVIAIHCGVADFDVKSGVMRTKALVLDTDVTTINAEGQISLADEQLDLTLKPKTKRMSLVALRTPIYIRGHFSKPEVSLDAGQVAARSLGAAVLAAVNPLLALLPLVETGPGLDSDCGRLIEEAKQPDRKIISER